MILLNNARHHYTVDLDSLDSVSEVDHPMKDGGPGPTEVFGSCNGIIGLSNILSDLAVYNPSTRQIHRLPPSFIGSPCGFTTRDFVFYGFGYDSVNDDYKVVRMVQFKRNLDGELGFSFPYDVKVFSFKSYSWKRIDFKLSIQCIFYSYYHLLFGRGYGVLASNSLHWISPPRPGMLFNRIMRFDLTLEEFGTVQFPEAFAAHSDVDIPMDIGVLDGCLCLMCYYGKKYVDVWMMKEHNVRSSWTKVFTVQQPSELIVFMRPLVYSKVRSKVLLQINNTKLVWLDIESKRMSTIRIKNCPSSFSAELVVSSLVLGCKGDLDNIKHRRKEQAKEVKEVKIMQKSRKRWEFSSSSLVMIISFVVVLVSVWFVVHPRDDFLSKGFKLFL